MEGNSSRAVGRILGIGKNMCLYWIRKYAKEIAPKETPNAHVNVIEMDELYSFVERKNRFYAITLVSRDIVKQLEKPGAKRSQKTFEKEVFCVNIV